MVRLPIMLEAPNAKHAYDVYINMPEGLEAKGHEAIIEVYANNRDQACRIAEKAGYTVRSVNMTG